ncbi:hypothetical protein N0M98_22420 [Paenibacillus doosanensis]|uniref:hypothetical protein n=1 Tax=Paenibacillus doosanensis TaxID=1229154 RepID=UPI0021807A47|nr:hypothetical protein [Paenibacillus doosanensis]MCS7462884.1 hypothetical protein [Paenibacillus doosanensis]
MKKQTIAIMICTVLFLIITAGCSEKTPPLPKVMAGKTLIPVKQSSYCWGKLGCADYGGPKSVLKGQQPTVVAPESNIKVSFNYKEEPSNIKVTLSQDEKPVDIPLKDGYFQAPKQPGIYYYGIFAYWRSDDGKHSHGDTSSDFVIEVQ